MLESLDLANTQGQRTRMGGYEKMLRTQFIQARKASSTRLLIMLHGLGDSMEGYRWLEDSLGLPWLNYLLVNAPDPYYGGFSWFDFTGDMTPAVKRSRELLFRVLDTYHEKGYSTEQTVLGGFSQGSLMSIDVGLRYPRVFAGIVGVSGFVHDPEILIRELSTVALQQRFLVTHGYMDPIVPFTVVRDQIQVLKSAGVQIDWHEFVKAHNFGGDSELQLIRSFIRERYGD